MAYAAEPRGRLRTQVRLNIHAVAVFQPTVREILFIHEYDTTVQWYSFNNSISTPRGCTVS